MRQQRSTDPEAISVYRTDRIVSEGGKWFFFTREGTMEGPFRDRIICMNQLDTYIKVMQSGILSEKKEDSLKRLYQQTG